MLSHMSELRDASSRRPEEEDPAVHTRLKYISSVILCLLEEKIKKIAQKLLCKCKFSTNDMLLHSSSKTVMQTQIIAVQGMIVESGTFSQRATAVEFLSSPG